MAWGAWFGVIVGGLIAALSGVLGIVFTGSAEIATLVQPALLVLAVAQPIAGVVFVLDGVLMGANDARYLAIAGGLKPGAVPAGAVDHRRDRGRRHRRTRVARGRLLRRLSARASGHSRLARAIRALARGDRLTPGVRHCTDPLHHCFSPPSGIRGILRAETLVHSMMIGGH